MAHYMEPVGFGDEFTTDHAHWMLDRYCKKLVDSGHSPVPYPDLEEHVGGSRLQVPHYDSLNHALWMCHRTREFIRQGRMAKSYRWIGMIQGILFMNGVYSLGELKQHNRTEQGA